MTERDENKNPDVENKAHRFALARSLGADASPLFFEFLVQNALTLDETSVSDASSADETTEKPPSRFSFFNRKK